MSHIGPEPGQRLETSVRRRAGTGRGPGSALIAAAAWLLALIGGGGCSSRSAPSTPTFSRSAGRTRPA